MSIYIGPQAQVSGSAQVSDSAQVTGSARVYGSARVARRGDIADTRHVLTIGPVGSEGRHVTIHRHYDGPDSTTWGHLIVAGCWEGTADQLATRVASDPKEWSAAEETARQLYRADYQLVIAAARARAEEWADEPLTSADHERWPQ